MAAGSSKRFGQAKLLLPWKDKSLIWHVGSTIAASGFSQVIVVTGKNPTPIVQALPVFSFEHVNNIDWAIGQSTSIKAGITALNDDVQAAMFFVGDQPKVSVPLVQHVIDCFEPNSFDITVPVCQGVNGNPVLFSNSTFERLRNLTGDMGGRSIFPTFNVKFVEWNQPEEFLDIDNESDYLELTGERADG